MTRPRSSLLTDAHRERADRRDPDGGSTSLREARELYRRQIDREHADALVMAAYLRAVELGNMRIAADAMAIARDHGFISKLLITTSNTMGASS